MYNPIEIIKRQTKVKVVKSLFFLIFPFLLGILTSENRCSISDYANASSPQWFYIFVISAGVMIMQDGLDYGKRWYNIVLGSSLIGVSAFNHLENSILHFFFAGVFFAGSLLSMVFYTSKKQLYYKLLAGVFIVTSLMGHFVFNWYSLFIAECLAMIPISLHFIGESTGKID